jgi:SAM-dependent methyltransferase
MTHASDGMTFPHKFRRWFTRHVLRQHWVRDSVSSLYAQEDMLRDKARCDALREAIRCTVKPGDVVVDLGAGTGLLSFFAIQAGARHVYAIEVSGIAGAAAELIEANGFRNKITLIRKNSKKVSLPERCDVVISETLSAFCFDKENAIEFIADARQRLLKPGGRIIPESADTFLLPISSDAFGVGGFTTNGPGEKAGFYDLDYRPFSKLLNEYRVVAGSEKPFSALSQPALCYHIDFRNDTQNPGKTFVPFRITADGRLDGFLGWFEARLCEGVTLSNSPYLPLTAWWQLYLPVAEQPHYRAGQTLLLCLDPNMLAGDARWSYAVQAAAPAR